MSKHHNKQHKEEPLIKKMVDIRYDYTHLSEGEWVGICMTLILFGVLLPCLIILAVINTNSGILIPFIIAIVVFACLPIRILISNYRCRKLKRKEAETIVANGTLVIGDIVSFNTTEIGNSSSAQKNFSYNIEYEDPLHGKTIKITTPSVIRDEMYLRGEDLPLKVTIYCYKGMAFAKSIINPPVRKMKTRKHMKWWVMLVGAIFITAGVFSGTANLEGLSTIFFAFGFMSMFYAVLCIQIK